MQDIWKENLTTCQFSPKKERKNRKRLTLGKKTNARQQVSSMFQERKKIA